ncbi:MAG: hypothetical protein D6687_05555 [Acidobacteria bacterium]|jgi:hypothetical protein|nr:MAG: hypothetical protein D6687_05555 [Acidobacteriota bacterium]GIU82740.1 MAG: hypothetical protein KatS3mg006_1804 [Pyrinomonadaceae bacterium]
MIRVLQKLWLVVFCFLLACQNEDKSSKPLFVFDETEKAAQLVAEANEDLKKIRKMYKENEGKLEEIKQAMKENKVEEVRKIADDVVYLINDGISLGESALEKLNQAEEMNINETYKEYLQLKRASLEKQLEAFEFRRQAAVLLRDSFGTKDKFAIERAKSDFKEREEKFRQYMEVARQMSAEANQIAKQASQRLE